MNQKKGISENFISPTLPSGVKDILPLEAAELKLIKKRLAKAYESWGYDEVFTPSFEYLDISAMQSGERIKKEMFKFLDDRGDLLALRPDMTTSIARMVSQKLAGKMLPIRLYYQSNVFRQQKPLQGQPREFWQSGVEIMGESLVAADAEVIMLLIDALRNIGLKDFKIALGNVAFIKSFLDQIPKEGARLKKCLSKKNFVEAEEILAASKSRVARNLSGVLKIRGQKVFSEAQKLSPVSKNVGIIELALVAKLLKKLDYEDYVTYDFSLVPDFDYYTGMVFEVYVDGVGVPVASGGRYDNLLPSFGSSVRAAGFAIGLERLHLALVNQKQILGESKTRIILQALVPDENLYALASKIRGKNKVVKIFTGECEDIPKLMTDWQAKWLVRLNKENNKVRVSVSNQKETKSMALDAFMKWVGNA